MTKVSLKYLWTDDVQKMVEHWKHIIWSEQFRNNLKKILNTIGVQAELLNDRVNIEDDLILADFVQNIQTNLLQVFDDTKLFEYIQRVLEFNDLSTLTLENIFGAKTIKKAIKQATQIIVSNSHQADRIQPKILNSLAIAMEKTAFELWKTIVRDKHTGFVNKWYETYGKLNFLETEKEKKKFAYTFRYFYTNILNNIIQDIEKLNLKNLHPTYKSSESKQIKKQVLIDIIASLKELVISNRDLEEDKYDQFQQDLQTSLSIFRDIFADRSIYVYLSKYNNYKDIFGQIFSCISQKQVDFQILTCPDYSGEIKDWIFHYDFKCLNEGIWCVGAKSIDLVVAMTGIFNRYLPEDKIRVNHYLPSFEFDKKIWFKWEIQNLTYDECMQKMQWTANIIKVMYDQNWINSNVWISYKSLTDEELSDKKAQKIIEFKKKFENDQWFKKLIIEIYKARVQLYTKWYLKNSWETDEEYNNRLINIVISQVAEYICMADHFSLWESSLMMACDSRIMYNAYAYFGYPIVYGQSKLNNDYAWA